MYYLAGPFFNRYQVEWLQRLGSILRRRHISYWCAMEQYEDPLNLPALEPEQAQQKYDENVAMIAGCDGLIAVLDWMLMPNQLCVLRTHENKPGGVAVQTLQPLNIPDTGTVFEMGLAYARDKPIIGVVDHTRPLNLMLAKTMLGVIRGVEDFVVWAAGGAPMVVGGPVSYYTGKMI